MQLPIAPQTYLPSSQALIRTVKQARLMQGRIGCQETALDNAIAFTRHDRPETAAGNWAMEISLPEQADPKQVLDNILAHFQAQGSKCRQLISLEENWPLPLITVMEKAGYRPTSYEIFLLRQYVAPTHTHAKLQIIPSRASYNQLRHFCLLAAKQAHPQNSQQRIENDAAMAVDMLDEPGIESLLGRLDHKPVGLVNILSQGQTGIIDSLDILEHARGQGIGSTLLSQAIDYCHRALFTQVLVQLPAGCPAASLYKKMGFVLAASFTQYQS